MENALCNIEIIKGAGVNGGAANGDHAVPFTATKDVAAVAADCLLNEFSGKTVRPILGPRDYTLREFTAILGKAIGKPELPYVEFPVEQVKAGMVRHGISPDMADEMTATELGFAKGIMNYEERNERSSSPTTAEEFGETVFSPVFNGH